MANKLLSELESGEKGRVTSIGLSGDIKRRLMDMGLVAGSEIEMVRVAPLGDQIDIKIKGYDLSLRKEVAAKIGVEIMEMPLLALPEGEKTAVAGFRGGANMQRRLADMGLTPGTEIKIITKGFGGPVLIELRGAKIALGRGLAQGIMVRGSQA